MFIYRFICSLIRWANIMAFDAFLLRTLLPQEGPCSIMSQCVEASARARKRGFRRRSQYKIQPAVAAQSWSAVTQYSQNQEIPGGLDCCTRPDRAPRSPDVTLRSIAGSRVLVSSIYFSVLILAAKHSILCESLLTLYFTAPM